MAFELSGKRIWVAGHTGMVGAALVRRLSAEPCTVLTAPRSSVDLRRQDQVERFVSGTRPDAIVLAAAKVGGIYANNNFPVDFLHDNLLIETNVFGAAHAAGVDRLLFLGSSCIYPKYSPQPIAEDALLTGPLEPTNEWYAVAKIAGIKLAQAYRKQFGRDYISAMPTNLYGPGDNFDLLTSHVLAALIRKAHDAKVSGAEVVEVWGSGTPRREFLYVDDCADALVFLLKAYSEDGHINVGSGTDLSILELATLICSIVGFAGDIRLDPTRPDGTPRKLMSHERLRSAGWKPSVDLVDGIRRTYSWFLEHSPASQS